MPRRHGYAPIGKRCVGYQDWNAKGRTNVIGTLIARLLLTICLSDTYINTDIFYAWLTQDLLPKLTATSVIVLDNATFYKASCIQKAIF